MSERQTGQAQRPEFTLEDFKTGRVFEWLTGQTPYRQAMEEPELAELAKELGFKAWARGLKEYKKLLKQTSLSVLHSGNNCAATVSRFCETCETVKLPAQRDL